MNRNAFLAGGGVVVFLVGAYFYRVHSDREMTGARLMRDMTVAQSARARIIPPRTRPQNSALFDGQGETASPTGALSDIPAAWAAGPERRRLERLGAQVYGAHCAACHGADGNGDTPVAAAAGMPAIAPFTDEKYARASLRQIYNSVCNGQGNMPAFGNKLSVREIWAAALQVRRFRDGQSAKTEPTDHED